MDQDYYLYDDLYYNDDSDLDSNILLDFDTYDYTLQYLWYEDIWKSKKEMKSFTMKCRDKMCGCRSHTSGDVYLCQHSDQTKSDQSKTGIFQAQFYGFTANLNQI